MSIPIPNAWAIVPAGKLLSRLRKYHTHKKNPAGRRLNKKATIAIETPTGRTSGSLIYHEVYHALRKREDLYVSGRCGLSRTTRARSTCCLRNKSSVCSSEGVWSYPSARISNGILLSRLYEVVSASPSIAASTKLSDATAATRSCSLL